MRSRQGCRCGFGKRLLDASSLSPGPGLKLKNVGASPSRDWVTRVCRNRVEELADIGRHVVGGGVVGGVFKCCGGSITVAMVMVVMAGALVMVGVAHTAVGAAQAADQISFPIVSCRARWPLAPR